MKTLITVALLSLSSAAFAATQCPISGKPVDPNVSSKDKDGKTVYFCCEKCKAKYDAKKK
jgi:YHS domain-containing protein